MKKAEGSRLNAEGENEAKSTSDVVPYRVSGRKSGGPGALLTSRPTRSAVSGKGAARGEPKSTRYLVPYKLRGRPAGPECCGLLHPGCCECCTLNH
jgi:hypothetical protein